MHQVVIILYFVILPVFVQLQLLLRSWSSYDNRKPASVLSHQVLQVLCLQVIYKCIFFSIESLNAFFTQNRNWEANSLATCYVLFAAALWNRNRNRRNLNFLTSGAGSVTC